MSTHLREGDQLRVTGQDEAAWLVVDGNPKIGHIKLFDCEEPKEIFVKLEDVYDKLQKGQWRLHRKNAPLIPAVDQQSPAYTEDLQDALRHLNEVNRIMRETGRSFSKAIDLARAEYQKNNPCTLKKFPAKSSLYRYREETLKGFCVLKGPKNKGRRGARYSSRVDGLIYDAAKQHYLVQGSSWTLARLTELINDRLKSIGLLRGSEKISMRYIRKVIKRDLAVEPEKSRLDPKKVAAAYSIGGRRRNVFHPFERVEQDALHLPFMVQARNHTTSSVWVVHAIDCATSRVVGWTFVIGSPTETDGLKCVKSILSPKKRDLAQHGIDPSLDIRGRPSHLVFDNGPEAKGQRMSKLNHLAIQTEYLPSRQPHKKPFVERLNRSLKEALETLPGSTRMNGVDGKRDPIALGDNLMTFEQLQGWVIRWYFQGWGNKALERLYVAEVNAKLEAEHASDGFLGSKGQVLQ